MSGVAMESRVVWIAVPHRTVGHLNLIHVPTCHRPVAISVARRTAVIVMLTDAVVCRQSLVLSLCLADRLEKVPQCHWP